ncbi:hypothetical protein ACFQ8S_01075 [Streptomyces virginiae]
MSGTGATFQAAWNSDLRLDGDGELDGWRHRTAQHFVSWEADGGPPGC